MLLRRMIDHVKAQNWTAVVLDFVIVVMGVFVGLQVNNWNSARAQHQRTEALVAALRTEIRDYIEVTKQYTTLASDLLISFERSRAEGEQPTPVYFRYRGADIPPQAAWDVALQAGLIDLVDPGLVFDLGFFYSEQQGISVKLIPYFRFVERNILPYSDDTKMFYDENGALKTEYAQNIQHLREWIEDSAVVVAAGECLEKRFDSPNLPGPSCRVDYSEINMIGGEG